MNERKLTARSIGMAAVIFLILLYAYAAAAHAADTSLQVTLQLGSDKVTVNDEELEVSPPYLSNQVTLVPLRVITAAFGADISWNGEEQKVGLEYDGNEISLQIGSKEAVLNGETVQLDTAPELKDGTTMVPLRFISETFGALVGFDKATQTITITGERASTAGSAPAETGSIDSDAGKTTIGDSYYGWSIDYPAGLVTDFQSSEGDWVTFTDAKGEYMLDVLVYPEKKLMS